MRKVYKKAASFFLCLLILSFIFCGCKTEIEYGDIQDVEITDEIASDSENVFTPVEDNLGYQYKEITHPRSYMTFSVPLNWNVTVKNARHLVISAPDDDPLLPGLTIHLLSCYTVSGQYHDTVGLYGKLFESDIYGLYYDINGKDFRQAGARNVTSQDTDTTFTERSDMISLAEYDDITMVDSGMYYPKCQVNSLDYYVKWAQIPMVFSTCYDSQYQNTAKSLLTYIVSSIRYSNQQISSAKPVTYDGITLSVPADFECTGKEDNVFLSSIRESTVTSGMGVGVFQTDHEVDAQSIMYTYADKMAAQFLPAGVYNNVYSCLPTSEHASIGGTNASVYTASCVVTPKESKPGDFYITGQTWYLTIYGLPAMEDGQTLIVIWSQDSQWKQLETVRKLIEARSQL